MKRKEVEDVMGGKGAWENVDRADGMWISCSWGGVGLAWEEGRVRVRAVRER